MSRASCGAILMLAVACGAVASAKESVETVEKGSDISFVKKIKGPQAVLAGDYKPTQTTYFLYLPDNYDPARAYPLILAIPPVPKGRFMLATWTKAAAKYPLIFVCPEQAVNETPVDKRGQMALDVLSDVRARHKVDPDAIYVTGFSGGGRVSSALVMALPDYFAGQIAMGGILFSRPEDLRGLKTKLGHYLFAGESCFNRPESEKAKEILKGAGLPAEILIGPGAGHTIADADQGLAIFEWFKSQEASRAKKGQGQPKETAARGDKEPANPAQPGKPSAAPETDRAKETRRLLARADNYIRNGMREEAIGVLEDLARQFPDTEAAQTAAQRAAELRGQR